MRRLVLTASVALLVSGCALTPDYERPELDVPEKFLEPTPAGESIANLDWWLLFRDETLQALIREALAENKDLGIALSRIAEARFRVTQVRADQFPFLDVLGSGGRAKESELLVPGSESSDIYSLGGSASYELDLWKRLSRSTESARADLLATEASYRNITISLVANVAGTYFLLRDLDNRLDIAVRTVETRRDSLGIIQARFDKGTVPELDVNQAEIELAIAEAAGAAFRREIAQAENAIQIPVSYTHLRAHET